LASTREEHRGRPSGESSTDGHGAPGPPTLVQPPAASNFRSCRHRREQTTVCGVRRRPRTEEEAPTQPRRQASYRVCGFGLFCVGYDGSSASRSTNAYVTHLLVWPIDEEGEGLGTNRWSDIVERKRNETDAKAGDELAAENKGTPPPACGPQMGPRRTRRSAKSFEKLKEHES